MNKNDLVEAVAGQVGDRRAAATAVEAVLGAVMRAVRDGEPVALSGFGVFEKVDRAARTARNPSTGATVAVPATSAPRFRPGQVFKDVVSGRRELPQGPAPLARTAAPAAAPVVAAEPVVPEPTGTTPVPGPKKAATKKAATKKDAKKPKAKTPKPAVKKSAPSKGEKKGKKAGKK